MDTVSRVSQSVQDRISDISFSDHIVPHIHRKLRADDCRAGIVPVFDDFQSGVYTFDCTQLEGQISFTWCNFY